MNPTHNPTRSHRAKQSNNTTGHVGVSPSKNKTKYRAYIMIEGINLHLGTYPSLREAVKARREAEVKYSVPEGKRSKQIGGHKQEKQEDPDPRVPVG
jgi:hypothetical protein